MVDDVTHEELRRVLLDIVSGGDLPFSGIYHELIMEFGRGKVNVGRVMGVLKELESANLVHAFLIDMDKGKRIDSVILPEKRHKMEVEYVSWLTKEKSIFSPDEVGLWYEIIDNSDEKSGEGSQKE